MSEAQDYYIPPEWLRAVAGKAFFYPCAGSDIAEPLSIFAPFMDELWFADIHYPTGMRMPRAFPRADHQDYTLTSTSIDGAPSAQMERRAGHRFLPPSRRVETYMRLDGSGFRVVRRRGFGEIGLGTEFPDRSIGVFFYRGDSRGEGGSGVQFFSNRRRRYEPLTNLFSLLCRKLTVPALIVTDGSNTRPRQRLPISQFAHGPISSAEAFKLCAGRDWIADGLRWTCVGFVGRSYGPTLVWAVAPV